MKPGEVFRVGTKVYEYTREAASFDGKWFCLDPENHPQMLHGRSSRCRVIADCTDEESAEAALRLNRLPDGPEVQR